MPALSCLRRGGWARHRTAWQCIVIVLKAEARRMHCRSACTYTGAAKLKEMSKRTTFIRVTQQLNPVFNGSEQKS